MIVSVTSLSFRLTTTESGVPLWTASLTSCVVWTGHPLMPMMTSWSIMPALWRKQRHKSLVHKALLKQTRTLQGWSHTLRKTSVTFRQVCSCVGFFPLKRQSKQWKWWGHGFIMHLTAWHLHFKHLLLLMILCRLSDNTGKTAELHSDFTRQ